MKRLKVLVVYANCMMDNLIPVGVSSLIGVMRSSGLPLELELFDTTFYRTEERPADDERVENLQIPSFNYEDIRIRIKDEDVCEDFRKRVIRFSPDIIMLSVVESTFDQGVALLNAIKDIKPYVVAGGIFAIMSPDTVISNENIDAICVGEGENAVVELCRRLVLGYELTGISGMWFKYGNTIIKNPLGPFVDINNMAFLDFSMFPKERFYKPMQGKIMKMVPIEFSRGCPYRCTYCVNHALASYYSSIGKWYRWKSMDRIFAEIEEYVTSYNIEFFYFVSESFLSMPLKKFDEFCERYSKVKIPFWFNTRPETLTKEIIRKLENINCFRIGVGIEHGNPAFREKILKRKASNEKIIEGCKLLEQSKISYSVNNIIGFPGETRDLVFDTIWLNRKINPDSVGTFVFTPFRGTELYNYCLQHGYIKPEGKVGDLNRSSVLENNILSQLEVRGLLRTFPLYVHFPEELFPLIERAEKFDDDGNRIFKELAVRYTNEHFLQKKNS